MRAPPRLAVGSEVELEWSDGWYDGVVTEVLEMWNEPIYHTVAYRDGDVKTHNLLCWNWRQLSEDDETKPVVSPCPPPTTTMGPALRSRKANDRAANGVEQLWQFSSKQGQKAEAGSSHPAPIHVEAEQPAWTVPHEERPGRLPERPEPHPPPEILRGMDAVRALLVELRLDEYVDRFEEQGFDDVEYLMILRDEQLRRVAEAVHMKPGHQMKWLTRMRQLQQGHIGPCVLSAAGVIERTVLGANRDINPGCPSVGIPR